MTDIVDKKTRSRMMAGIKGKNTKPELKLRKALHRRGFRYRLHSRNIAGKPDLVLPKFGAVIFVHGCFWHRHPDCRYATLPSTRLEFWQAKFEGNIKRDKAVQTTLASAGWRVAIIWECGLRKTEDIETCTERLADWLIGEERSLVLGKSELQVNL